MIYEKDSVSIEFFALMLSEAMSRNLNCKDIAQDILDFRKKITGSNSNGGPNSSGETSSSDHSNEGVNWVTGQST
jgi:hypothetical protein